MVRSEGHGSKEWGSWDRTGGLDKMDGKREGGRGGREGRAMKHHIG